jgi:hypothetical protein
MLVALLLEKAVVTWLAPTATLAACPALFSYSRKQWVSQMTLSFSWLWNALRFPVAGRDI